MSKREASAAVERLRALGVDPATGPAQALEKLRSLRSGGGASITAIAAALGAIEHREAAEMLAQMEAEATGRERREIRRALFRLRQKGIEASPAAAEPAPKPHQAADIGLSALISPIDPEGARIVWLLKERTGGGMSRLWGLASDREGLVGATLAQLSRRELRKEREEIEGRAAAKLIEAEPRLADFILCEAYRNTPEARRGLVGNFLALRAEIIPSPPETDFEHPVYRELRKEVGGEPASELLEEPEVKTWNLPAEDIKPYLEEIEQIQQSPLLLNRYQNEERVGSIVERAVTELLSGKRGERIRRRFEDLAYYMARRGRHPQAVWAAAAAVMLRDGEELRRSAFFQKFVRAKLGAAVVQQQEEKREEPRLIVTPAEAMRAQRPRGR